MRVLAKGFIEVTSILAFLFVMGRVGALEVDCITVRQAVISCMAGIGYMFIAIITHKILSEEKENGGNV